MKRRKNILAVLLAVTVMATAMPGSAIAAPVDGQTTEVSAKAGTEKAEKKEQIRVISITDPKLEKGSFARGTKVKDMKLPDKLSARGYKEKDSKKAEDIKIKDVTWKTDYKEDSTAGKYTFTAQITDDYKLAKDVVLPKLTIEITEAQTKTTEKQPETKQPETKQPETKATEAKKPETKTTEKTPEVKKPETKVTEKETEVRKPETKVTEKETEVRKPETKMTEKKPETKTTEKQPETKATEKKPETKISEKQPETKAAEQNQPETKADAKAKNAKSTESEKESETKQSETKESETKQSETKESETKQSETKESETKQSETKESETKQSETKESETKESETENTNLKITAFEVKDAKVTIDEEKQTITVLMQKSDTDLKKLAPKITVPAGVTVDPASEKEVDFSASDKIPVIYKLTRTAEDGKTVTKEYKVTAAICKHDWKEATCTEAAVCKLCGVTGEAALGHDWTKATCKVKSTCKRCKITRGKLAAHTWSKWKVTTEATHEKKGKKERKCGICKKKETKTLPKINWIGEADNNKIEGLTNGGNYATGANITFKAVGDRMDNKAPIEGDVRYLPVSWTCGTGKGDLNETNAYGRTLQFTTAGTYTLNVTYERQLYKDGKWITKGDANVQTAQLKVTGNTITTNNTNKSASGSNSNVRVAAVTGDNSPIVLLSIVLAASLAALIALFVSGRRRKNNRK